MHELDINYPLMAPEWQFNCQEANLFTHESILMAMNDHFKFPGCLTRAKGWFQTTQEVFVIDLWIEPAWGVSEGRILRMAEF